METMENQSNDLSSASSSSSASTHCLGNSSSSSQLTELSDKGKKRKKVYAIIMMKASASICRGTPFTFYSSSAQNSPTFSPLLVKSMATPKPLPSVYKTVGSKKNSTVFPPGEQPRSPVTATSPIKLLTRMEQLKLLSKAEKAGLLSAAEKFGLSLSTIEKLGLLSKAEELGVLSAATDPATPGSLLTLSFVLLLLGPLFVYLVPEDNLGEVGLQVVIALFCVLGGSAGFAASNFVSNLQKSK